LSNILVISLILFNYFPPNTGSMQEFVAANAGKYMLESWGAEGSGSPQNSSSSRGGKGGYTMGYYKMLQLNKLYACVGQRTGDFNAGYNGGGYAKNKNGYPGGGGGGASHIATTNRGILANYYNYQSEILIVAGGGGGSDDNGGDDGTGGSGGGESGYNAYNNGILITGTNTWGCGATQSTGYAFGQGGATTDAPNDSGGGGGGWYGGFAGHDNAMGGGGGSGHINTNNIINGHMDTGVYEGNGYIKITQVSF